MSIIVSKQEREQERKRENSRRRRRREQRGGERGKQERGWRKYKVRQNINNWSNRVL